VTRMDGNWRAMWNLFFWTGGARQPPAIYSISCLRWYDVTVRHGVAGGWSAQLPVSELVLALCAFSPIMAAGSRYVLDDSGGTDIRTGSTASIAGRDELGAPVVWLNGGRWNVPARGAYRHRFRCLARRAHPTLPLHPTYVPLFSTAGGCRWRPSPASCYSHGTMRWAGAAALCCSLRRSRGVRWRAARADCHCWRTELRLRSSCLGAAHPCQTFSRLPYHWYALPYSLLPFAFCYVRAYLAAITRARPAPVQRCSIPASSILCGERGRGGGWLKGG
jgi:hypothetical protein